MHQWPIGAELTVSGGDVTFRLRRVDDALEVRTTDGGLLDPLAADVLIALGGDAPVWLSTVEGLRAVDRWAPGDPNSLQEAMIALNTPQRQRAQLARTTTNRAVLVALAGSGTAHVVQNPLLTRCEWDLLQAHRDQTVTNRALALATVLPVALWDYPDAKVRGRVARNPLCPAHVLVQMSTDPDIGVRAAVAANPNTATRVLAALATAPAQADQVRRAVAANPHVSRRTLRRSLRNTDPNVRAAAAANPKLPKWRRASLVGHKSSHVRRSLASRPDTTARQLIWIERCSRRDQPTWQAMIRSRLRSHPNATPRLKQRLREVDAYVTPSAAKQGTDEPSLPAAIPFARKLAVPSPLEAVMIIGLLPLIVLLALTRPLFNPIAPLIALELLLLVRCRTVRPKSLVAKPRRLGYVPKDERLQPAGRWRAPVAVVFSVSLLVTAGIAASHQHASPSLASLVSKDPAALTVFHLHQTSQFASVTALAEYPLSAMDQPAAARAAAALEALAIADQSILDSIDPDSSSADNVELLAIADGNLIAALQRVDTTAYAEQHWNQQEPAIVTALEEVELEESVAAPN